MFTTGTGHHCMLCFAQNFLWIKLCADSAKALQKRRQTEVACVCMTAKKFTAQNERYQLIKAHALSGEITGEHFQSLEYLVQKCGISLIWLHSLVC